MTPQRFFESECVCGVVTLYFDRGAYSGVFDHDFDFCPIADVERERYTGLFGRFSDPNGSYELFKHGTEVRLKCSARIECGGRVRRCVCGDKSRRVLNLLGEGLKHECFVDGMLRFGLCRRVAQPF